MSPTHSPKRPSKGQLKGSRSTRGKRGSRRQPRSIAKPSEAQRSAELLVERLARALHRYGTPAHRLEEAMSHLAASLGLESQFFSSLIIGLLAVALQPFAHASRLFEPLVAVALVTGLLVANVLVPPRRDL